MAARPGQTAENRAKPSPPPRSPLNLNPSPEKKEKSSHDPAGFLDRTRLSHEALPTTHWHWVLGAGCGVWCVVSVVVVEVVVRGGLWSGCGGGGCGGWWLVGHGVTVGGGCGCWVLVLGAGCWYCGLRSLGFI
jgi:hypothetical protein